MKAHLVLPLLFTAMVTAAEPDLATLTTQTSTYESGKDATPLHAIEALVLESAGKPELRRDLETALLKLLAPETTFEAKRFACQQLAVVGSEASVPAIAALFQNEDTASIAALALAAIPLPKAAEALRAYAAKKHQPDNFERALLSGQGREALLAPGVPTHIRRAALTALLKDGDAARILGVLRGNDAELRPVAIAAIRTSKEPVEPFAAELPKLPAAEREMLIESLAARGGEIARTAIAGQLEVAEEPVRIAAITALGQIGDAATVPLLVKATLQPAAEQALISLPGGEATDRAIVAEFDKAPVPSRPQLIAVLASRNSRAALPFLVQASASADAAVAKAAFQALGRLGTAQELPALLDRITTPGAGSAARRVLARMDDPLQCSELVRAKLSTSASPEARIALLALLPAAGDAAALVAVNAASKDADPRVQDAAIRALAEWPSTSAWESLLAIYERPDSESHRVLALRGLVRLAATEPGTSATVARYRQLLDGARNDDDRRLILGSLGGAVHPDALPIAKGMLDNAAVRAEAAQAVKKISAAIKAQLPGPDDSFRPLFDGKTFTGWEGNQSVFRIEDGAIVGGNLKANVERNEYLCTAKRYRDFELRLKFKLLGENVNGGVQFRSERLPNSSEMIGYQADMGQSYWGCLYDERRHKQLAGPAKEEQQTLIRRNDWNDYVIRAEGRHVQLWLNGQKTVDYTEPDASIPQEGVFGIQIHKGAPADAWYKDLVIRELAGK